MIKIIWIIGFLNLMINYDSPSPHVKAADIITEKYIRNSAKEGLRLFGSGGAMMDDIKMISVSFESNQKLTVAQARKLFVRKVRELLDMVNQDKEIRPYLHDYPFTAKNISLSIYFQDKNRHYYTEDNSIAKVSMPARGTIYYKKYDPDDPMGPFITFYEESFEEAEKIVREQK